MIGGWSIRDNSRDEENVKRRSRNILKILEKVSKARVFGEHMREGSERNRGKRLVETFK